MRSIGVLSFMFLVVLSIGCLTNIVLGMRPAEELNQMGGDYGGGFGGGSGAGGDYGGNPGALGGQPGLPGGGFGGGQSGYPRAGGGITRMCTSKSYNFKGSCWTSSMSNCGSVCTSEGFQSGYCTFGRCLCEKRC
ncbi:hypothetical protein vseg_013863 [Gypsophila vaccaria]